MPTHIATDTVLWSFDNSLSAYKYKANFLTIASALQIVTTGTLPQLTAHIKEHLHTHPDLASNPRFAGLFRQGGQWHANNSGSHSEPTMTVPATSLLPTPLHSYSLLVGLHTVTIQYGVDSTIVQVSYPYCLSLAHPLRWTVDGTVIDCPIQSKVWPSIALDGIRQ